MADLEVHPWPGDVQELRNTIESMVVLGTKHRVELDDVPEHIRLGRSPTDGAESKILR